MYARPSQPLQSRHSNRDVSWNLSRLSGPESSGGRWRRIRATFGYSRAATENSRSRSWFFGFTRRIRPRPSARNDSVGLDSTRFRFDQIRRSTTQFSFLTLATHDVHACRVRRQMAPCASGATSSRNRD